MSKRCPECLRTNEDARAFCAFCGATLDPHLRLIQDLEKQKDLAPQQTDRRKEDMSFYVSRSKPQEKKKSAAPWIILGLIAVAAVVIWLFMHG